LVQIIPTPTLIQAAGSPPKQIAEFIGRVNTGTHDVSIAHMKSPEGWSEPGQTPEFDEYSIVLRGKVKITTRTGSLEVIAGQSVIASAGEWVQYSTPEPEGAEYLAICVPAFSPESAHRDEV
jgi:mannose-6-phosphate isomerase-like protein (cupin superfamily)